MSRSRSFQFGYHLAKILKLFQFSKEEKRSKMQVDKLNKQKLAAFREYSKYGYIKSKKTNTDIRRNENSRFTDSNDLIFYRSGIDVTHIPVGCYGLRNNSDSRQKVLENCFDHIRAEKTSVNNATPRPSFMDFGKYLFYRSGTNVTRSPYGLFHVRSPWDSNIFTSDKKVSQLIFEWRQIVDSLSNINTFSEDVPDEVLERKKELETQINLILSQLRVSAK